MSTLSDTPKAQRTLFEALEDIAKKRGPISIRHSASGSGMGLHWTASAGGGWPYCSAATLEWALRDLVSTNARLEREELQKRINEIDASSGL